MSSNYCLVNRKRPLSLSHLFLRQFNHLRFFRLRVKHLFFKAAGKGGGGERCCQCDCNHLFFHVKAPCGIVRIIEQKNGIRQKVCRTPKRSVVLLRPDTLKRALALIEVSLLIPYPTPKVA